MILVHRAKRALSKILFRFQLWVIFADGLERARLFLDLTAPPKITHPQSRVGPSGDGGYLLPVLTQPFDYCFSPGVGNVVGFDLALANAGIPVFLLDGSIERLPQNHELFKFEKKFLGALDSETHLSLKAWMETLAPDMEHGILQMDIEGAEYEVLVSADTRDLSKFACVVLEFHQLELLVTKFAGGFILRSAEKLNQSHIPISRHVNNNGSVFRRGGLLVPSTLEVTYLRRDLFEPLQDASELSFQRNIPSKPDIQL